MLAQKLVHWTCPPPGPLPASRWSAGWCWFRPEASAKSVRRGTRFWRRRMIWRSSFRRGAADSAGIATSEGPPPPRASFGWVSGHLEFGRLPAYGQGAGRTGRHRQRGRRSLNVCTESKTVCRLPANSPGPPQVRRRGELSFLRVAMQGLNTRGEIPSLGAFVKP